MIKSTLPIVFAVVLMTRPNLACSFSNFLLISPLNRGITRCENGGYYTLLWEHEHKRLSGNCRILHVTFSCLMAECVCVLFAGPSLTRHVPGLMRRSTVSSATSVAARNAVPQLMSPAHPSKSFRTRPTMASCPTPLKLSLTLFSSH